MGSFPGSGCGALATESSVQDTPCVPRFGRTLLLQNATVTESRRALISISDQRAIESLSRAVLLKPFSDRQDSRLCRERVSVLAFRRSCGARTKALLWRDVGGG